MDTVKNQTEKVERYFSSALCKANIDEINENIFSEWQEVANAGLTKNPPKGLPNPNEFLLNNYTRLSHEYMNDVPKNTKETIKIWSKIFVDVMIKTAKNNATNLPRPYGQESLAVNAATKYFNISGLEGVVIGSLNPWAEAYALANGAKHITTIDYQKYIITHPQMDYIFALDLPAVSKKYYNKFDFAISFSSIEHSGLGRYGDPIDPIGDLREMNKIHCLLKPKGLLFLGLPVGIDSILYNAHRVYGRIRLAMMFEGH
uniref:DUF268 domain-containing protein n=1 Tax=Panagrolaimus davidi TaxID=227884 RepID=A0A914QTK5_9BILA